MPADRTPSDRPARALDERLVHAVYDASRRAEPLGDKARHRPPAAPRPGLAIPSQAVAQDVAIRFIKRGKKGAARPPSTLGFRRLLSFLDAHDLSRPVTGDSRELWSGIITWFGVHLAVSSPELSPRTISSYISSASSAVGLEIGCRLERGLILSRFLGRLNEGGPSPNFKLGASASMVRAAAHLSASPLQRCAVLFAFDTLCRAGEIASVSQRPESFKPGFDPSRRDVSFERLSDGREIAIVRIHHAKCDNLNLGHSVAVVANGGAFCPVLALHALLDSHPPGRDRPSDALFAQPNGNLLTTRQLSSWVKEAAVAVGLDPRNFSSHSLRIGGCMSLAAAGIERYGIKLRGRWVTDSFERYLRSSPGRLLQAAAATCLDPSCPPLLPPGSSPADYDREHRVDAARFESLFRNRG